MAKNYSEIFKSVYTDGNSMSFGNAMLRGNGVPLDITEVYDSYLAAVKYAATNAVAYEGQLIAVTENNDTTVYVITPAQQGIYEDTSAGTGVPEEIPVYIKEVGKAPVGDDATVKVVDGKIQLANLAGKASGTYQPFLVDGVIQWREPSTVTVEGLDARLETAEQDIEALETTVGDENSGLVKKVADVETVVSGHTDKIAAIEEAYALADTNLKDELQDKIDEALQAAKDYADENDANTVYDDEEVRGLITSNTTEIGRVNENVVKNADDIAQEITNRQTAVSNLETSLKQHVATEIGKQAHFNAQVVTSTEAMTSDTTLYLIKVNESDDAYEEYLRIDDVPTKIGTTTTDLSGYDTSEQVASKIQSAIDTLSASLTESIQGVSGDVTEVSNALTNYKTEVSGTYETKTNVAAAVKAVDDKVVALTTEVGTKATQVDVSTLTDRVDDIETDVETITTNITNLQNADTGLASRIQALEDVGAEKNFISSVDVSEFTVTDGQLTVTSIPSSKVSGVDVAISALQEGVAAKVDKISGWTLLSPDDQAKLAALTLNGDEIQSSAVVEAGSVKGLATWVTGQRDSVPGLLSSANETKLAGIAAQAQVNVIEKIKIDGTELTVDADKSVTIPFATNDVPGVVLGSSSENHVSITVNGTMEVNRLNVNKLTQTDGDTLILNGGNALT